MHFSISSIVLTVFLILGIGTKATAQSTDEQLAVQYYQEQDYEKAIPLLETLSKSEERSDLFGYYLKSLIATEKLTNAEKELKQRLKRYPSQYALNVELAHVYDLMQEDKKASKLKESIVEGLKPDEVIIQSTANGFLQKDELAYAIAVYEQGQRILDEPLAYALNLAPLYGQQEQKKKMLNAYLGALRTKLVDLEQVKAELVRHSDNAEDFAAIRDELVSRVQAEPQNELLVDLLSGLFISKREFYQAFVQLRAIDKRRNQGGSRLVGLAKICINNQAYDEAEEIYDYVIGLGKNAPYYAQARLGKLNLKYTLITELDSYSPQDLEELKTDYETFLLESLIPARNRAETMLRLAEIEAVYMAKPKNAIKRLSGLKNLRGLPKFLLAEAKIDLGNYYLLDNDIWEASLLYSQVEKDFKEGPIGQRAKFLNAKLSFYRGEFEWCKAQLDVLKGATSELIANDALQLSLLIEDNLALDTLETPLQLYARSDMFIYMNRIEDAKKTLDTIQQFFPNHSLDDEILFAQARIFKKERKYQDAVNALEKIYSQYAGDLLADDALLMAAELYELKLDNSAKAMELYEKILFEHKASVHVVKARKRFRLLRGDSVN